MTTFMTYKEECESLRQQLKDMTYQYHAALEAEQVRYRQVVEKDAEIARLYRDQEQYGPDKVAIEKQAWVEAARQRQINELRQQLAASQAREQQLRAHLEVITGKRMSADNCLGNVEIAELALTLPADTNALSAMIAKAGEMMRERTHSAMLDLKPWDHRGEIIRALPAVTIDDLKCSN